MPKNNTAASVEEVGGGATINTSFTTTPNTPPGSPMPADLKRAMPEGGVCDHMKEPLPVLGTTTKLDENAASSESHVTGVEQLLHDETNTNCLLLEDTTLECAPLHLRQLLTHMTPTASSQVELLVLLIYTVALESGFIMENEKVTCCNAITHLSPPLLSFHAKNMLALSKVSPAYTYDSTKSHFKMSLRLLINVPEMEPKMLTCLLTAIASGDYLIATLSPYIKLKDAVGYSVCLSIGRYVLNQQARNKPLYSRFRKLDELSLKTRDQLFVPMRNQLLTMLEVEIYPSLLGLPTEMYDHILKYLTKNQRNIVANVNRLLRDCVKYSRICTPPAQSAGSSVIVLASQI